MPDLMSFSFTQLNFQLLIPMAISLMGGIIILLVGTFNRVGPRELYISLSILFILLNLGFLFGVLNTNEKNIGFFNMLNIDGISILTQVIILISALFILPFFAHKKHIPESQKPEFYALILFSIAGFSFMVSTKNLILILLGLECASLSIYTLIAIHNRNGAIEAAIKYFIMGALATAFYALGAMLLYTATGSVEISHIASFVARQSSESGILLMAGFAFLMSALGFKLSLVPFHTWGPDVYQGSNSLLAAFIAIAPKIATLAILIRIFDIFHNISHPLVTYILYGLVVITITIPNLIALVQKDVKRLLAYSSISHSGFILAAILINTPQSHTLIFFYWALFLIANIGAFGVLWFVGDCDKNSPRPFEHPFESFSGMFKTSPILASILSLFMISLAGIPPLSVFWGKLYLLQNAISAGFVTLAVIMALNSIIAAFYYLKVVIYIFIKEPTTQHNLDSTLNASGKWILGILTLLSLSCIILVQNLLNIITEYIK